MGRITDFSEGVDSYEGGIFTLRNLTAAKQKSTGQIIVEGIERIISLPQMQPMVEQTSRLIGAYADKLILDNQGRLKQIPGNSSGGTSAAAAINPADDDGLLYGEGR